MTTSEGIRERLARVVQALFPAPEDPAAVGSLVLLGDEGVFDSMSAFQLMIAIENEFAIVIEDGEITPENFRNLENLERFVRKKLSAKVP
jgi:acyl carrier protein